MYRCIYDSTYTPEFKKMCAFVCVSQNEVRLGLLLKSGFNSLFFPTWDVFSPANVHHQLSVRQVTQCSQGLDVAVWYCWVWHGVNLFRLGHQQVRDDFVICKAAKGN